MTRAENVFPPNLPTLHERTSMLIRRQREAEEAKRGKRERAQWEAQYKALLPLCWADAGLCIRPARTQAELTEEGERLCHCVAGYGSRVCAGETHVLFIRRVERPDEPYYTLNLSPKGEIIQCHGYKNDVKSPGGTRPESIKAFERRWMEERVKPWLAAKARAEKRRKAEEKQKRESALQTNAKKERMAG